VPDARSDVFSLGVLLFHAWHGRLPAVGSAAPTTRPLEAVIARAMHEDPERRLASAGALRDALLALEHGPPRKRTVRGTGRIVAALVAACLVVGISVELSRREAEPSLAGAWHMRSDPIGDRGAGAFVVEVTGDHRGFVMDYRSGLMRCTFTGRRCEGTWYGRSGDGWYHLDLSADGAAFVGRWGYRDDHQVSAEIRGTRVRADE
jgi:hypothetical protein